ncbi:hypothetical protein XELAEV_18020593mg [Xenopus laevis]|uniref:Uncharacterized protein n=1 Tax=Xenopus laevis TaxID=8355 RepID=A0A974D754_XENLA|nr:hypothetical protein XELAEV_18020593mg [Xenopus laevis]
MVYQPIHVTCFMKNVLFAEFLGTRKAVALARASSTRDDLHTAPTCQLPSSEEIGGLRRYRGYLEDIKTHGVPTNTCHFMKKVLFAEFKGSPKSSSVNQSLLHQR